MKLPKNEYDVVVANIVADVIIALAPKAREYMKKGGVAYYFGSNRGQS